MFVGRLRHRGYSALRDLASSVVLGGVEPSAGCSVRGEPLVACASGGANARVAALWLRYFQVSSVKTSEGGTTLDKDGLKAQFGYGSKVMDREATVKRLLYRSKQRGFLEMDLIIGQWAEANVSSLSDEHLNAFAMVLDEENPDLFRYLTGQEDAPQHLEDNIVYEELRKSMEGYLKVGANARAKKGVPWVRGWDDSGKGMTGNQ